MRLYLALGVVIAFLGLAGVAMYYRAEAIQEAAEAAQARADLETALVSNRALEATVGRLRASAEANDKLMAEMADTLDKIGKDIGETNNAIGALKESSDEVRDYLALPVPADLRQLLDK